MLDHLRFDLNRSGTAETGKSEVLHDLIGTRSSEICGMFRGEAVCHKRRVRVRAGSRTGIVNPAAEHKEVLGR